MSNEVGADHVGGGGHVGIGGLGFLDHAGLIAGLDQDLLDALDVLDLLDLAILNVGGDDVGSQGQIPNHIQGLAVQGLLGNGLGHLALLGFQLIPILHRLAAASSDISGGKAFFQGGGIAQHDGDADHVRVGILLRVCACFICVLSLSPVCTGKVGCLYSSGRRDALSAGPSHTAYGYYTISLRILQRKCRSFSCKIDRNFDKHKNRQFVCDIATYCDFLHKSRFMYKPSWSF